MNPDIDIDGVLASSGDLRFNSIDVKLASGLMTMMQRGGEHARIKHLCDLQYPGDDDLAKFKSQWNEVLECMRPADVPNEIALRNILYDQVKGSKLMAFDLHYSESKQDSHAEKTYQYLIGMMSIQRLRPEEKNCEAKTQGSEQLTARYKSLPATTDGDNPKPAKAAPTPRVKAAAPTPPKNDAAPVLADPKVKPHAKGDRGGKGKGKDMEKDEIEQDPLVHQGLQRK